MIPFLPYPSFLNAGPHHMKYLTEEQIKAIDEFNSIKSSSIIPFHLMHIKFLNNLNNFPSIIPNLIETPYVIENQIFPQLS